MVGVDLGSQGEFDASLDELALLAESAGDIAVARVIARRKAPDPALFIGSGKAEEIKALVLAHAAEAVEDKDKPGSSAPWHPPIWDFWFHEVLEVVSLQFSDVRKR